MRLFTGIWPPQQAVRDLLDVVQRLPSERPAEFRAATAGLRGFRFSPAERWHLTLCFHGDDADPDQLGQRLELRLRTAGTEPPRMRLAGAGVFAGVLWVAAEPAQERDARAWHELVRVAGADPDEHRTHLTVARWRSGHARRDLSALLGDYQGPWWSGREVALVRSDPGASGPKYTTLRRVRLTGADSGEEGEGCSP